MSSSPPKAPVIYAAGAVVLRGTGKKTEVLVVHRKLRDDWSLPKGKRDKGELLAATAVREIHEETGLHIHLGMPLSAVRYMSLGKPKLVRYWVGKALDDAIVSGDKDIPDDFVVTDEVDEVRWVRVSGAKGLLSYSQDVDVLKQAVSMPRFTSPLVLLRHAEAEKREAFALRHDGQPPADDFRPLTPHGFSQTPAIAAALRAFGITTAHSSPAERCMSTIAPSFISGFEVVSEASFSEWGAARDRNATKERMREVREIPKPLVVCSHRPVLPTLMRGVAGKSKEHHPSRKLKPGDFAVFHRAADADGMKRKFTIVGVEHSNEEF